jgi:hypothetical protein
MPSRAKLAGMGKDGRAVAFEMLVEPDAGAGLGHDRCERGLADLKWITPQVVAVQLDEVEGVQEHVPVVLAIADTLERCEPVIIAAGNGGLRRRPEENRKRSAGDD